MASQDTDTPSQLDHTWAAWDHGTVSLTLDPAVAAAGPRPGAPITAAVVSLAAGTAYELRALPVAGVAPTPAPAAAGAAGPSPPAGAGAAGTVECANCQQRVPASSYGMHETFCVRNNSQCALCGVVYLKRDAERHWHCPDCGDLVAAPEARVHHARWLHTPLACPCGVSLPLERMRGHRRVACPLRVIVCRFCGDRVVAGPLQLGTGLGEHEAYCGSRTVDCTVCGRKVAMKVAAAHTSMHDLERRRQPLPMTLCRNVCCTRAQSPSNALGLCQFW